jgi:hypothetical protein
MAWQTFFYLQDDLYSDNTKKLVEEKYNQFTPVINRLFVLDKNDIVTTSLLNFISFTIFS